jgi:glycosyltransferase involved in cell wall biosynthesis
MTVRVLVVIAALRRGGLEDWVAETAIAAARSGQAAVTVAVREAGPFPWTEPLREAGVRLVQVPGHPNPWRFAASLRRVLAAGFDAVHSHIGPFNGIVLHLAEQAGVPVRISHVHADEVARERTVGWWRRPYHALMRRRIARHANRRLAVSGLAAGSLHGAGWRDDPASRILPLGLDLGRFAVLPDRVSARAALGLGTAPAVLALGRLDANKNHRLLIAAWASMPADALLLIAGDGPERTALAAQAAAAGVADRVRLLGRREDVPALLAAADAVAHPSLAEGFGFSVLEAQAAGLPLVVSTGVPVEAIALPERAQRLPPDDPAGWSAALVIALALGRADPAACVARLAALGHDRAAVVDRLIGIWEGAW